MKRIIALLLLLALTLSATACTDGSVGESSVEASSALSPALSSDASSALSSVTADSSEADSVEPVSSEELLPEYDGRGWLLVENVRLNRGLSVMDDHSSCFYEGVKGYVIEGSPRPYRMDEETIRRVIQTPCEGSGSILWRDYNAYSTGSTEDQFDGVIPVSKINDPIFVSMNMPSEALTSMTYRINPQGLACYPDNGVYALPIGAVYPAYRVDIPDDETFTVCLGRINLALKTKDKDWYLADDHRWPTAPNHLYYLPWDLERTVGRATLPNDRIREATDHVEVTLTGADLNGVAQRKNGAIGAVLHFWGAKVKIDSNDVTGLVASYVVWVKEPEAVGKLVATIGADWYNPKNETMQAFTGYNYLVTNEPRTLIGHTVGPKSYDEIMNTDLVQQLIGVK